MPTSEFGTPNLRITTAKAIWHIHFVIDRDKRAFESSKPIVRFAYRISVRFFTQACYIRIYACARVGMPARSSNVLFRCINMGMKRWLADVPTLMSNFLGPT